MDFTSNVEQKKPNTYTSICMIPLQKSKTQAKLNHSVWGSKAVTPKEAKVPLVSDRQSGRVARSWQGPLLMDGGYRVLTLW